MDLPLAVRKQEEESNRLFEQMQRALEAPPVVEQVQQEPAQEEQPPTEPPPPEPPKDREDWKFKYATLKGKYDAEVPRLHAQIRDLHEQMKALKAQTAAPAATPEPIEEEFDPKLVDAMKRIAEAKARELVEPVAASTQRAAFDRFVAYVRAAVPDQEQIDSDPQFDVFMSERDEFSGRTRQELLEDAVHAGDANRVIAFYRAFKSTVTGANPPPAQPPRPAPPVTPPQSGVPGAPAPAKVYTRAEVAAFYSAVTKGHYRGREAEAEQIGAEVDRAFREGRVR